MGWEGAWGQCGNQGCYSSQSGACWHLLAPASRPVDKSQINSFLPCPDRVVLGWTWVLEVTGVNKNTVGDTQEWCSPAETVDASWVITREIGEPGDAWRRERSWALTDANPDSPWSGWKVLLCERPGTYLGQEA